VTRLRKMMLEELQRRNYSEHTTRYYIGLIYTRGISNDFHFALNPSSLRLPGESRLACVDRVQSALLGKTGQAVLNRVTGASTVSSILTQPTSTTAATLISKGTTTATNLLPARVIVPDPRTSMVGRLAGAGLRSGETLPSTANAFTNVSSANRKSYRSHNGSWMGNRRGISG
jgi:hypothetical protein